MRKTFSLCVLLLVFLLSSTAGAMDFDFDDLFGDGLLVDFVEEDMTVKPEEALLTQDSLDVGGNYRLTVNASRTMIKNLDPMNMFNTSLGGQLYLDARPNPDFRIFGKAGLSYDVSGSNGKTDNSFKLDLVELFSDFNYNNQVFFRAGKQNVKWGVGYFFSPADVINIGRIDPMDPTADREGPVALKIHYPQKSNNYYLYTLFDDVTEPDKIALAPKVEFVVGRSEIGLGGFYQKGKAPRLSATVSSSLGSFALFGEAVVSKGLDIPLMGLVNEDEFYFQATGGASYSHNDPDGRFNLTGASQYYYNGEGSTGRHYLATMVGWNKILGSKLSASAIWSGNLSDQSGMVNTTLTLPSISEISPSVGVRFNYGKAGTEFNMLGVRNTTVFLAVTLGSGSF